MDMVIMEEIMFNQVYRHVTITMQHNNEEWSLIGAGRKDVTCIYLNFRKSFDIMSFNLFINKLTK